MKSRMQDAAIVALLFFGLSVPTFAADLFSGSWKMNVAKSTFSPGPPPDPRNPSGSGQKIEAVPDGLRLTGENVNGAGQKTHTEFTVKFDGKDYPYKQTVDGMPAANGVD